MILKLRTKSMNFEDLNLMANAGIPEQTEAKFCFIAVDSAKIEWIIENPFEKDTCFMMYEGIDVQTTIYMPFNEVVNLWSGNY